MALLEVTASNYEETITKGIVVLDFWAPWCGPCKMYLPILEEVSSQIGDKATIAKMNVDDHPEFASKFGIMGVPTTLVFKNGALANKVVGLQSKETILKLIEE